MHDPATSSVSMGEGRASEECGRYFEQPDGSGRSGRKKVFRFTADSSDASGGREEWHN